LEIELVVAGNNITVDLYLSGIVMAMMQEITKLAAPTIISVLRHFKIKCTTFIELNSVAANIFLSMLNKYDFSWDDKSKKN
jgi:hypothetical protein